MRMIINFTDDSLFDVGICRGGGGSAGTVKYPDFVQATLSEWVGYSGTSAQSVTNNIPDLINAAIANNPISTITYEDPTTGLADVETDITNWKTLLGNLAAPTDVDAFITDAVTQVDTSGVLNLIDVDIIASAIRTSTEASIADAVKQALTMLDNLVIERAVRGFYLSREVERAKVRKKYKAGAANTGEVRSSSYALGLALIENEFEAQASEFQSNLETTMFREAFQAYFQEFATEIAQRIQTAIIEKRHRDNTMLSLISSDLQYKEFIVSLNEKISQIELQEKNSRGALMNAYKERTLDADIRESLWELEAFELGSKVVGAAGGGTYVPRKPPVWQQIVGDVAALTSSAGQAAGGFAKAGAFG